MNMNYENFKKELKKAIESHGFKVVWDSIEGNEILGIDIENSSPAFYMKQIYDVHQNGWTLEQIVLKLLNDIQKVIIAQESIKFSDIKSMKSNIILFFIDNKEDKLKEFPHRKFMDLMVGYFFYVENDTQRFCMPITYQDLEKLKLTEEELYEYAVKNTPRLLPFTSYSLEQFGLKHAPSQEEAEEWQKNFSAIQKEGLPPMFIVTNEEGYMGANCLICNKVFEELSQVLMDDLLLVCSKHEVVTLPFRDVDIESAMSLIKKMNTTIVHPDDVLSHSVYRYNRLKKQIEVVVLNTSINL